jgi:hypothetical protein
MGIYDGLLFVFQDLKEQNLLVQESKQLLEEELSSVSLQQKQLSNNSPV